MDKIQKETPTETFLKLNGQTCSRQTEIRGKARMSYLLQRL